MLSNMIDEYELAYFEDLKLECALEKFKDFSCSEINWVLPIILILKSYFFVYSIY